MYRSQKTDRRKRPKDCLGGPNQYQVKANEEVKYDEEPWDINDETTSLELSDTYAAIKLMLGRIKHHTIAFLPISVIFQHQIYAVIKNRTQVDQEINQLKRYKYILCMRIPGNTEITVICLKNEFLAMIRGLSARMQNEQKLEAIRLLEQVLNSMKFQEQLIPIEVLNKELEKEAQQSDNKKRKRNFNPHLGEFIRILSSIGLILPRRDLEIEAYQLSIPGIGKLVGRVKKARSDILALIKGRRYHEILEKQLKKNMRGYLIDLEYHLQDMIGIEIIERIQVTSGQLIRVL